MLIQLILLFILFCAMFMTRKRMKQKALRPLEAYVWSLVWIGSAAVVLQPDITSRMARFVGIGRGADLVVYSAVVVLLLLVFQLHIAHERLERQLTELVRKMALENKSSNEYQIAIDDGYVIPAKAGIHGSQLSRG